jgi:predicted lipoprotein
MEYLLFVEDAGHACPSQVQINAGGAWDDLVTAGIDAARAAHAVTVSQRIIDDLDGMSDAWTAGFAVQFSDPTESDNGVFATHDEALTAAFHALFYIEGQTKDRKLAIPLGLRNCSSDVCPAEAESPHASASLEHIAANIDGFEHLFFGADGGMGFDDLLIDRGYEALVTEMEQAIVSARTAVAAVDGSLETAIVDDLDSVIAVYDGTKSMTDLLKGDISTALLLQIPSELVGDND